MDEVLIAEVRGENGDRDDGLLGGTVRGRLSLGLLAIERPIIV